MKTEKNKHKQMMYASTHTHSIDWCDAQNSVMRLFKTSSEYNAAGLAITQHGSMSVVDAARKAAAEYKQKYVPGIEIYVTMVSLRVMHLILLCVDDIGYEGLCMLVSEASNKEGFAVASFEQLQKYFAPGTKYHGKVIATSACINGVLAMVLRQNESVAKDIKKLKAILGSDSVLNPADETWISMQGELEKVTARVAEITAERAAAKKLAGTKFTAREKKIAKLLERGNERAEEEMAALEADKQAAYEAGVTYNELTDALAEAKAQKGALSAEMRDMRKRVEHYEETNTRLQEARQHAKTKERLIWETAEMACKYDFLFGHGNFYIEVQNHGIPKEAIIYPVLAEIAGNLGIPLIASNDVHTVTNSEDELLQRQILRSMRFGKDFEEAQVGDDQLYLKTDEELSAALREILPEKTVREAMANIRVVFDRCNVAFEYESHYPKFPSAEGKTANQMLEEEVQRGIMWRFDGNMPPHYYKRLKHELDVIESMGYADYHLIVKDFLEYGRALSPVPTERISEAPLTIEECRAWTKKNGWTGGYAVGPGRGSAVGSLVCYLLGITALDPIKYNLFFERFLNPERVSMPDIDSDISNAARKKVIDYITNKYGVESVCGIMTVNALAAKGTLRTAARFYAMKKGMPGAFLKLGDAMAKFVPETPGISFDTDVDGRTVEQVLLDEFCQDDNPSAKDAKEILRWAKAVEGCFTSYGAHAAGIVISDGTPVKKRIPLRWNDKLQEWTTQCDKEAVEENGFLKMDVLGLKTLDIITEALGKIMETRKISIDPLKIPLDDKQVYKEIFCKGRTNSVFQFESDGMKNMLKRFEPDCFEDLVILVSMFRPGPMQYIDNIIRVKHGEKPVYLTEQLEEILGRTYAGIVYQGVTCSHLKRVS